jgi:hypothetical protein
LPSFLGIARSKATKQVQHGKGRGDVLIGLVRCLRERLEPVAREPPFTTIADFGSKGAFYRRFRPKEAPLAI